MQTKAIAICICLIAVILITGCTLTATECCNGCGEVQVKNTTIIATDFGDIGSPYYLYSADGMKYGVRLNEYFFAKDHIGCNVTIVTYCGEGHYRISTIQLQNCQRPLCSRPPQLCECGGRL